MRIEQEVRVARPPEDVFGYLTDTEKLAEWQKGTVEVRRDASGPLTRGERLHEVHAAMGRRLESTVEVAEIDPPRAFALHVVDGPMPVDGRWTLEPDGSGTLVRFTGEGSLKGPLRIVEPIVRRTLERQFRGHHERLKRVLEGAD
jgi:uncharacterized protein YndB with AHSA1/START domain